jgi:hypothetical protein
MNLFSKTYQTYKTQGGKPSVTGLLCQAGIEEII